MHDDHDRCDTERLFRDWAPAVGRWAARLSGSACDTDDIVQEVFLTVHRQAPALGRLRSPPAWLLQITRNVVRHVWRTRARVARREGAPGVDTLVAPAPDPLEELERRRAVEQLEAALRDLDERYRDVYVLCEVKGLPPGEVAALTGLKPETLRVRRFRARRQMAERLGDQLGV